MKEKRNKGDIFISLWIALGVIIILGFFVFSMVIGGSAGLGYQENGHFFVRDHSEVVEVSKTIWEISYIWGIFAFRCRAIEHAFNRDNAALGIVLHVVGENHQLGDVCKASVFFLRETLTHSPMLCLNTLLTDLKYEGRLKSISF